jgi:N-acetylneuraminic acid mutarotase
VAFAANGKGYVGMGMFVFGGVLSDFFEYDPITDTWTEIASISPASDQSCGFSLNGDGYVYNVGGNNKSIYRYSVADDQWVFESSFPGDRIANATITTLDGKAYLSNGERTLSGGNFASNQIWAFTPSSVGFDEKYTPQVSVFQQANGQIYYALSSNDLSKQTSVSVFDLTGRLITTEQITQEQGEIHIPKASGCYILQFISNGSSLGSVKVLR